MAGESKHMPNGEQVYSQSENGEENCIPPISTTERRKDWARKSRELKKNPWKFPAVSSGESEEKDSSNEQNIGKDGTRDGHVSDSETEEYYIITDSKERKCKCFLKVSLNIDSVDEIDGVCEEGKTECLNAVSFLQSVPEETRQMVAKYLSTGNPEHLQISKENLHHIFHLAKMLNLQQLYNQCIVYCSTEITEDVKCLFDGCECEEDIINESKTGYQRVLSVVPSEDKDAPPEFYIVFSRNGMEDGEKKTVMVIDMSEKLDIFQKEIEKLQQLSYGSDCCSCYKKDSPYVFACGGEGKFSQALWKYDVLLGRWQKCAKMLHERFKHCLMTDRRGSLFVIGGNESGWIDEYKICSNKWMQKTPLETNVHSAVCAMYQDKIYIFGGQTTAGSVSCVQCYDIDVGIVTSLPKLPCAFFDGRAVVYENKIFIATRQGHMICFHPETGESYLCSQQPVQRDHFGMFLKHDRIYLVGGIKRDGGEDEATPLYRYNPMKDTWNPEPNLCKSFPVYSSCIIRYPRYCPIVPFNDRH